MHNVLHSNCHQMIAMVMNKHCDNWSVICVFYLELSPNHNLSNCKISLKKLKIDEEEWEGRYQHIDISTHGKKIIGFK